MVNTVYPFILVHNALVDSVFIKRIATMKPHPFLIILFQLVAALLSWMVVLFLFSVILFILGVGR